MSDRITVCSSCGAPIRWGRTARENAIPLEAEPAPDGNLVIERGLVVCYQPLLHSQGFARYRAHFASCPHAARWRRRKSQC